MECADCGSTMVQYIVLDDTAGALVPLCSSCFTERCKMVGEVTMTYWYLPTQLFPPSVLNILEELVIELNRYLRFERERYNRLLKAYDLLKKTVEQVSKLAQKTLDAEKHVWEAEG
ncbi:hypothetical protein DRO58_08555 [Candidatus Bathyarchaeota archaeon]|nr:MAG: hypothetical protein DRO58_08555 [Candidatus Bathyarchaeota archaeon]